MSSVAGPTSFGPTQNPTLASAVSASGDPEAIFLDFMASFAAALGAATATTATTTTAIGQPAATSPSGAPTPAGDVAAVAAGFLPFGVKRKPGQTLTDEPTTAIDPALLPTAGAVPALPLPSFEIAPGAVTTGSASGMALAIPAFGAPAGTAPPGLAPFGAPDGPGQPQAGLPFAPSASLPQGSGATPLSAAGVTTAGIAPPGLAASASAGGEPAPVAGSAPAAPGAFAPHAPSLAAAAVSNGPPGATGVAASLAIVASPETAPEPAPEATTQAEVPSPAEIEAAEIADGDVEADAPRSVNASTQGQTPAAVAALAVAAVAERAAETRGEKDEEEAPAIGAIAAQAHRAADEIGPEAKPGETQKPVPTEQVATAIQAHAARGDKRFEIRLDPPELGRVDVRMNIGSDGEVRAHLIVERTETLDLMLRDQRSLERALEQTGMKLGDSGLSFTLRQDGGGQQGRDGWRGYAGARESRPAGSELDDPSVAAVGYLRPARSGGLDLRV